MMETVDKQFRASVKVGMAAKEISKVSNIKYAGGGRVIWEHSVGEKQEVRGAGSRSCRRQVSQYHREKYCLEGEGNLKWTQSVLAEVLCFCNHSQ